jgi:hypothetical protein
MRARSIHVFAALMVAACSHVVAGAEVAAWTAPDPGLLRDATFDAEQRGERRAWVYSQHAGQTSYRFNHEPGMLRIERIGPEPWGQASQHLDARPLVGQTLEFSAELSGRLTDLAERQIATTGLSARIRGFRAGMPRMLGKAILLRAAGKPELSPSTTDWTPQSVRFKVPEGATDIDVTIRLGTHGSLSVRGPSLVVVDATGDE